MESQGLFYLGNFSKQHKLIGEVVSKPFYIKFPKMIESGIIPYHKVYDKYWFDVELYWNSYSLPNIIQVKNLVNRKVNLLDRKVDLVLRIDNIEDIQQNIETLVFNKYYIYYDKTIMLESIKDFIKKKFTDNNWSFEEYTSRDYYQIGNPNL